jgi:hypothetical protein
LICISFCPEVGEGEGDTGRGGGGTNNVYTYMKMQKQYLLKLFQESGGRGEFKYNIFDTL